MQKLPPPAKSQSLFSLGPVWATVLLLLASQQAAVKPEQIPVNYDESKVGNYTLPDPLLLENGERVNDPKVWYSQRRPELIRLFEENVYGRSPERPKDISWKVLEVDKNALGGKAIRKQVTIYFSKDKNGPADNVLIYLPLNGGKRSPKGVPLILTLNFSGNHSTIDDPAVRLGAVWDSKKMLKTLATEESRGKSKDFSGAVEKILARGYGFATIYYCDIEPDFNRGIAHGVRPLFFAQGQTEPRANEWGALAAWGWGLSRALDYMESDTDIDAKKVAIMGHSRLGKAVLWAGARDQRFAMVLANSSGEGGASLARRNYGETIKHLNVRFPYWFCANYKKYSDHVDDLPVDTHELIALIAPRYVHLGTAEQDQWADPKGEFLAAVAAGPVFRLLGRRGLEADEMPTLNSATMRDIGFHYRAGKHEVLPFDWEQYLKFADMHLR